MSSDTTVALLRSAFDRLLAYVDIAGRSLTEYLGTGTAARIYFRLTPDAIQYPYVVLRISAAEPDIEVQNLRTLFTIEARCVNRAEDGTIEQIADLVEEALLTWQESSPELGVTFGQFSRRESQEPLTEAPNRDLAESTVWVTCASWAKRLTALA